LELLKHNREKIFGVYGLPPFRGGVMEYSNYANALAQDKDFWLNTIKPILKVIEDGLNKQLLWPIFGDHMRLRFDLDDVPALKTDQTELVERLLKLKKEGVVSVSYVREQLDISEDAAPDNEEESPAKDNDEQPTDSEEDEVQNALYRQLKTQRDAVLAVFSKTVAGGCFMSALYDPQAVVTKVYDTTAANTSLRAVILPKLRQQVLHRGMTRFSSYQSVFDISAANLDTTYKIVQFSLEAIVEQTQLALLAVIQNADQYRWPYWKVTRQIRGLFTLDRAESITKPLMASFVANTNVAINELLQNTHTVV
jgi:hypothetical protein